MRGAVATSCVISNHFSPLHEYNTRNIYFYGVYAGVFVEAAERSNAAASHSRAATSTKFRRP